MDFSFQIDGLDKLVSASTAVLQAVNEELAAATYAGAQQVATDYKKSVLAGGKTGRLYKRRTVTHQASAPGEAPASDTGRLVNAVHVELDSALSSVMRVATRCSLFLELGTSRMAARPASVPAMEKNRNWIVDRLAKAV